MQVRKNLLHLPGKPSLTDQKQLRASSTKYAGIRPRLCPSCLILPTHLCEESHRQEMFRDLGLFFFFFKPGALFVELVGGSSVTWA